MRTRMQWGERRRRLLLLVLVAWLLAVPFGGVAHAADGDPAVTFGGDGKVTTTFPGGAYAQAGAIQPDGKIVAAGAAAGSSRTGGFALTRYETDGTLDATFGTDGRVTTAVSGAAETRRARSRSTPTAGSPRPGTTHRETFALARYDSVLDPEWGGAGEIVTKFKGGASASGATVQTDGKIVVVGATRESFALARYLP